MKRLLYLLSLGLLVGLTACGPKESAPASESTAVSESAGAEALPSLPEASEVSAKETASSAEFVFSYDTMDLDGNEHRADEFSDYDLTLLNIWASWCGPCRAELPTLAKLAEKYADRKVRVVGLLSDAAQPSAEAVSVAKNLLAEANADYLNLLTTDALQKDLLSGLVGVPTSLLLDSKGQQIGEPVIGARDEAFFSQWIEETLQTVKP